MEDLGTEPNVYYLPPADRMFPFHDNTEASDFDHDRIGAPIEEIELYIYVQKSLSLLPIGDRFNETDENGELTIEFPKDLPGDTIGLVNVNVKIEDANEYADTSFSKVINWGRPLIIDMSENKRELWAAGASAPIYLLILQIP